MGEKRFGVATKGFIFKDGKILTLYKTAQEAAHDPNPELRKDQPGGRTEFGEDPNKALLREIFEETGLEVKVIMPLNVWHYVKNDFQLVGINFLCEWVSGEVILSEEHEAFEWLTLEEICWKKWRDEYQYVNAFSVYEKYLSCDFLSDRR